MPRLRSWNWWWLACGVCLAGCHAWPDPSCAVRQEFEHVPRQGALYQPNWSLEGLGRTSWFRCPQSPQCGPICPARTPPRPLADSTELLALPGTAAPATDR